ncbi:hypothetical protein DWG93_19675 [Escherichia coli]|nr:hypothetical protein C1192_10840 [Escherichia marmotae]EFN9754870.1 hypothetical protein [Escherichia coli]EFO1629916.1 hypothetical protein [Escherichia coli]PSY63764.1 hypothetical protein C7B16_17745 [Escherichia sp. 20412-1]
MIICSPVLLWVQYSRVKTFIKRINHYGQYVFILSKKTANDRLVMHLLIVSLQSNAIFLFICE